MASHHTACRWSVVFRPATRSRSRNAKGSIRRCHQHRGRFSRRRHNSQLRFVGSLSTAASKRPGGDWLCVECGAPSIVWGGRCSACGAEASLELATDSHRHPLGPVRRVGMDPVPLLDYANGKTESGCGDFRHRFQAAVTQPHLREFDVVMGGGILPGSLTLLGGEPGVGKTTLLLQVTAAVAASFLEQDGGSDGRERRVLYATGEETVAQVAQKAARLLGHVDDAFDDQVDRDDGHGGTVTTGGDRGAVDGSGSGSSGDNQQDEHQARLPPNLDVICETSLERLENIINLGEYPLVVIDSVQTCATEGHASPAGSAAQLRNVASRLMHVAKREEVALLLAGHVTKEGGLAGPRLLEHLVDVVLYFEGSDAVVSAATGLRVLRCHKNRFGPTHELGIFSMGERGLVSADEMALVPSSGSK